MSKNTALIVVVPGSNSPESKTHFGNFMALILSRANQKPLSALAGQASWTSAPIEEIVLSGLWVIIEKLAGILGEGITTQAQAQKIAARVERLVVFGFFLVYESVERAAEAFEVRVLEIANRAIELGYRPGMNVAPADWTALVNGNVKQFRNATQKAAQPIEVAPLALYAQMPAALFFAELVKAARDAQKKLTTILSEIKQNNSSPRERLSYCELGETHHFEYRLWLLDETEDRLQDTADAYSPGLADSLQHAELLLSHQRVMRSLKFNPATWPPFGQNNPVTIDANWLNTQIILAQLKNILPTQETLESVEQYLEGIACLHQRSQAEVVKIARKRLLKQQHRPLNLEEAIFLGIIGLRATQIRAWGLGFEINILDRALVHVTEDSLNPSQSEALEIAENSGTTPLTILQGRGLGTERWLEEKVAPRIDWKNLRLATALEIISATVLPPHCIAAGITKIRDSSDRTTAIAMFLKKECFDGKSLQVLASAGIKFEWSFVKSHLKYFEPETFNKLLLWLLEEINDPNPDTHSNKKELTETLWRILPHLSRPSAHQLVSDVHWRKTLCDLAHSFFPKGQNPLMEDDIDWLRYDTVRNLMGERPFQILSLSEYVAWRTECYRTGWDNNDGIDEELVPWNDLFLEEQAGLPNPRVFGPKVDALKANEILRGIDEEEAFRWVYAYEPNVDELWENLKPLREKFWSRQ